MDGTSVQPGLDSGIRAWPPGLTRVPFWVYQEHDVARQEQARIFQGATWNFLCLEADIPNLGDFRTTFMGAMPVIVVRGEAGAVHAFENRCAHRGALIALDDAGNAKDFACVYHAWRYDLCGNLVSVAFRHGVNGQGGMAKDFDMRAIGPRKLRTATFCGLVFGTLSEATPPIEDYLGEAVTARVRRVLKKPVEVIGRFTQPLPNNWKLYVENVKDTYHASLLHLFFATFRITRLSQGGGVLVSESGAHHASTTLAAPSTPDTSYRDAGLRSDSDSFRLADPSLLDSRDEWGDGIQLQILTVFPGFVLQQIHNCIAVRQVVPRGVDAMDLHWTYLGFTDDTAELRAIRLKQNNLVGPAGFVSMEDGCVGGFVQRATGTAEDEESVVEMGGTGAETQPTRATEAAVRGFWKEWRRLMGM
ncbi:MAG TPA: aromatic ring-hydroxylating dioxygenase subunit alpha [Acetobacteraceae bacterium]|nr:aromatic ring-hydroxylating dioxygenase subunit alpha [Acetobacteraceae bacterium]